MECLQCNSTFCSIPDNLSHLRWHPALQYCQFCFATNNRLQTYIPFEATTPSPVPPGIDYRILRCPECSGRFEPFRTFRAASSTLLPSSYRNIHYCGFCYCHRSLLIAHPPAFGRHIYDSAQVFPPYQSNSRQEVSQQYCFINPTGICSVCLDNFQKEQIYRQLVCGHNFHNTCISTWLAGHSTCPVCRHAIYP